MRRQIAALMACLLLTACGGGAETGVSNADDGERTAGLPDCAQVWVAGEALPDDYDGCDDGETTVALVAVECVDGSKFTSHLDRYWANLGGEIKDSGSEGGTTDDADYAADYTACLG